MVTPFELIDRVGKILEHGEIDGKLYRVFSDEFLGGYKEFEDTAALFAAYGGCAIQPEIFQSCAEPRQLTLLDEK